MFTFKAVPIPHPLGTCTACDSYTPIGVDDPVFHMHTHDTDSQRTIDAWVCIKCAIGFFMQMAILLDHSLEKIDLDVVYAAKEAAAKELGIPLKNQEKKIGELEEEYDRFDFLELK